MRMGRIGGSKSEGWIVIALVLAIASALVELVELCIIGSTNLSAELMYLEGTWVSLRPARPLGRRAAATDTDTATLFTTDRTWL